MGIDVPSDKKMEQKTVFIKKAEARRIERDRELNRYKYAFDFMNIDKEIHQELTKVIYRIQRQFLQNR